MRVRTRKSTKQTALLCTVSVMALALELPARRIRAGQPAASHGGCSAAPAARTQHDSNEIADIDTRNATRTRDDTADFTRAIG